MIQLVEPGFEVRQGNILNIFDGQQGFGNAGRIPAGEHPHLVLGALLPPENDGKAGHQEERENDIPSESGPIPQKFAVPGHPHGDDAFEHTYSLSRRPVSFRKTVSRFGACTVMPVRSIPSSTKVFTERLTSATWKIPRSPSTVTSKGTGPAAF